MNKSIYLIIWLLLFCILPLSINSAWVNNHPSKLEQPDGTIIDVLLSGDEYHNWAHDINYYTIIQDPKTGFWCWGKAVDGDVESTGYPVHLYSIDGLGINPGDNISELKYSEKRANWESIAGNRNITRSPTIGVIQNLTIFIKFADQSEFQIPLSFFDDMLNPMDEGVNSLFRYYFDASYEQLHVYSTFYPTPNGNAIVSYQDAFPRNYYMPYNSSTNPNGYTNQNQYSRRVTLLRNALNYAADFIPTTLIIDSDGDGIIDNINFLVRGNSGAWANLLWPHMSNLYNANIVIHGKRAGTYNFNMEDRSSSSGVGVFAHEFGHSLGVPDYYRYNTAGTPIGSWDLMASDRNPPQSHSAWSKYHYLRWSLNLRTINQNGSYYLYPNTLDMFEHAYRINSPNSTTEFFVIEYRKRDTGLTDGNIPGEGLVVYRVNSNVNGNSQGPPDELYIYRPNGTLTTDGVISNAAFSENYNRTAINDLTNPSPFLSNGNPGGLNIYNIGTLGEYITFDVNITGPDMSHYSESFEDQTFSNFDWMNDQVAPWTIVEDSTAPHGSYCAASGNIDINQTSELSISIHHEHGYVHFWLKTSTSNNGGFLRFYMDGIEIKSWAGNNNWQSYAIPVTAGPHRYSWVFHRNANAGGGSNKVWIDRISFPDYSGHFLYPAKNVQTSSIDRDITVTWQPPYNSVVPNTPTLLGYNLYDRNFLVTTTLVESESYVINNVGGGNMLIGVVAVYETGEAELSDTSAISIPLAPANLNSIYSEGRGVKLNWDYQHFSFNLAGFRIYRNGTMLATPNITQQTRFYHDTTVSAGTNYSYYIRAAYTNPIALSIPSDTLYVQFVEGIDIDTPLLKTHLGNNYPNPFNPNTTIHFSLNFEDKKNEENVKIIIYNIKGQQINTLINKKMPAGNHTINWDGTDIHGKPTSSGIYFYKMETDHYQSIKKMVLLK